MRLLSLCSGYGGLDLAVESVLGAETVAYAEMDKKAASVFARHWPDVPNLGDLTAVDWAALELIVDGIAHDPVGSIDIVTAGFPCQDLSYAGKGAGIVKDSRSGLWYGIEHALGVLRPRHVFLENVSAVVTRRPGLDVVLAGLARLGFDAEWTCLRAADVGAPHGRNRWFLVAHARGSRPQGRTPVVGRANPRRATASRRGHVATGRRGFPAADADGGRRQERVQLDRDTAPSATDGGPRWGHADRHHPQAEWGDYAPAINRWEAILGRPAPAPTDERGRLSPLLVEFMMGLPQGWVTDTPGLSRADMLKILGNGVVPQQAAAAISALLQVRERAA